MWDERQGACDCLARSTTCILQGELVSFLLLLIIVRKVCNSVQKIFANWSPKKECISASQNIDSECIWAR